MKPDYWPVWIEDSILAKSVDKSEGGKAESLAQHTWLVLSRLVEFVEIRKNIQNTITEPRLWHCLYWGTFLHDFGKVMPAFQGVLRGDKTQKEKWAGHRHEVFSLAFLEWIKNGFTLEEKTWVIAAIVSHHKEAFDLSQAYPIPDFDEEDPLLKQFDGLSELHVQGLNRWLYECGWHWAQLLKFDQYGVEQVEIVNSSISLSPSRLVQSIRKGLLAYRNLLRKCEHLEIPNHLLVSLMALRGTLINADHSASGHRSALPVIHYAPDLVYEKRNIQRNELYVHQKVCLTTHGSTLLIAPTGSGKTEAALMWATTQISNNDSPPRLFYTLPYQASMNAMRIRLGEIFGDEFVGLLHGRSSSALYHQLMDRKYEPGAALQLSRDMRDLNRLNYPPIRIFSPYTILKAMYRLKGYEAQLTDYYNALFIFDEIHAYEVQRLALIVKTMQYLKENFRASFFIMSATFPTLVKRWLEEVLGKPNIICATAELFDEFQRHTLKLLEGELLETANLQRILIDAHQGKSILVVCNTVDRAQQAYTQLSVLKNEGISVELLHGRFNQRDRLGKEKKIQTCTGSKSLSPQPIVLVATQVVEVSLDIDLDTIYTDPAPLEALIQRFGRINRRRKQATMAPVHVFTLPNDGQKIYDPRLVNRTIQILSREDKKPIPENKISDWLDEIYEGEIAKEWADEFSRESNEFDKIVVQKLYPFSADQMMEKLFYQAFDSIDVLPESLMQEYDEQCNESRILANELLIPIRWGRYHALLNRGLIKPSDRSIPPVVKTPYSTEYGLTFEKREEEGDL